MSGQSSRAKPPVRSSLSFQGGKADALGLGIDDGPMVDVGVRFIQITWTIPATLI